MAGAGWPHTRTSTIRVRADPQQFYFAQMESMHAGKTMVITLSDPGEASRDSFLRFLSPQGGTYHYATFSWESNDGRSGTNVTEIQTASTSSGALFNNRILTIEIPLPTDYGAAGLDPNGIGEDGWWIVEYDVRAANDTTTWEVAIRGNPVAPEGSVGEDTEAYERPVTSVAGRS